MIRITGLTYRYPESERPALESVDLEVMDGEILVVAGESGGGKSTLVRAMTGLVPHFHGGGFAGNVVVAGRDTREHKPRDLADVIGFVGQDPESQAVVDRVEDEIVFAMENLGVAPVAMRRRLEEVLDALGLAAIRDRRLDTLSGGERQRVAIASVLAAQPRVLVLDEPTSQLDPQSAEDVLATLHRLNADLGLTIVCVEHRLERVVQHADRIAVVSQGRIRSIGTPRDVLATGDISTPVSAIGRALGWSPLPITVREGRAHAATLAPNPKTRTRSTTGESLVRVDGLTVTRDGRDVLRDVSLDMSGGECVAIVGRNGSGKTTLLRALVGLLRPRSGTRLIAGMDPADTPVHELARRVAFVPQTADALLFADTVVTEIAFTLKARAPGTDARAVLEDEGLAEYADRDPRDLSAGIRLRTAIVAATAGAPRVVMLDEPTRGMDAAGKDWLAAKIAGWRQDGCAVLLVTHDVELVARVASRVASLAQGQIVLDGAVDDVLGESVLFSTQMNKVFRDRRILTVEDALAALR